MDVVVPREIDGVTVVGFANYNAFDSCHDYTDSSVETNRTEWVHLRTLVLPETIRELPDMMLGYCQQLENLRLLRAAGEHRLRASSCSAGPEQRDLCQRRAQNRQLRL